VAHTFLALRAGGIVNIDDSSAVSSVADHGQSLPDAGAANLILTNVSAPAAQAGGFVLPQAESTPMVSRAGSVPVFLQVDSAPGTVTAFHSDPSSTASTVSTTSAGLTLVTFSSMAGASIFSPAVDGGSAGSVTIAALPSDGWFVVPSASNEYGDTQVAAGDGFSFDVATGEFTAAADWFIV